MFTMWRRKSGVYFVHIGQEVEIVFRYIPLTGSSLNGYQWERIGNAVCVFACNVYGNTAVHSMIFIVIFA